MVSLLAVSFPAFSFSQVCLLREQPILVQGLSYVHIMICWARPISVIPVLQLRKLGWREGRCFDWNFRDYERKEWESGSLTSVSVYFNFPTLLSKLHGAWHIFTWQMLMWKRMHIDMPLTILGNLMLGLTPSEYWWFSSI